ncbi:MAG TPA: hypothetical protein VH478_05415 [Trebonia sp.]|jgi:hypothetical protein|nr:hypothetical protein [Trebonia sp.]
MASTNDDPGARGPRESALEQALEAAVRDALGGLPAERVIDVITRTFPKPAVDVDPEPFHGRVQKVSVSMPEPLTTAIRDRTGPGGFSRFVAEAAEKRLRHELLGEYLDELDGLHGPVPPQTTRQVNREWREALGEE